MTDDQHPPGDGATLHPPMLAAPVPRRPEPPIIARARAMGWLLLGLCLLALAAARVVPLTVAPWLTGGAIACAILGGLAIVNVALVRSLYRQIDDGLSGGTGDDAGDGRGDSHDG